MNKAVNGRASTTNPINVYGHQQSEWHRTWDSVGFGSDTEDAVLNKLDSLSYRRLGTNLTVSWLGLLRGQWSLGSVLDLVSLPQPSPWVLECGLRLLWFALTGVPGDLSASWVSQNTQCPSQSQLFPVRATTARKCPDAGYANSQTTAHPAQQRFPRQLNGR